VRGCGHLSVRYLREFGDARLIAAHLLLSVCQLARSGGGGLLKLAQLGLQLAQLGPTSNEDARKKHEKTKEYHMNPSEP
jgi:hypothetical protein